MLFVFLVFLHESRLLLSLFHFLKLSMLLIGERLLPHFSHVPINLRCSFSSCWESGVHLIRNCLSLLPEVFANLFMPCFRWFFRYLFLGCFCFLLSLLSFSLCGCFLCLLCCFFFHFFSFNLSICFRLLICSLSSPLFIFLLLSSLSFSLQ